MSEGDKSGGFFLRALILLMQEHGVKGFRICTQEGKPLFAIADSEHVYFWPITIGGDFGWKWVELPTLIEALGDEQNAQTQTA